MDDLPKFDRKPTKTKTSMDLSLLFNKDITPDSPERSESSTNNRVYNKKKSINDGFGFGFVKANFLTRKPSKVMSSMNLVKNNTRELLKTKKNIKQVKVLDKIEEIPPDITKNNESNEFQCKRFNYNYNFLFQF